MTLDLFDFLIDDIINCGISNGAKSLISFDVEEERDDEERDEEERDEEERDEEEDKITRLPG
jgi:hypothetical protein